MAADLTNDGTSKFYQSILASDQEVQYTCIHCHKVYKREDAFFMHQCIRMKREQIIKTPTGQTAWEYYQLWFRLQNRLIPPLTTFLASKGFTAFVNFVEFTQSVNLPQPEKFIQYMIQKNFHPQMWVSDPVYVMYIEHLDRTSDPIEQATLSVKTLLSVCDRHNVDSSLVFTKISGQELIYLLKCRKLSPWLLLNSKQFKKLYVEHLSKEQRSIVDKLIRVEYWKDKFLIHGKSLKKIKLLVDALGI